MSPNIISTSSGEYESNVRGQIPKAFLFFKKTVLKIIYWRNRNKA